MKPSPPSKTQFERYLNDNPPLDSTTYKAYVSKGGKAWGHYYRENFSRDFNKSYENFWLKHPELWEADYDER